MISAIKDGVKPMPINGINNPNKANEGLVCIIPVICKITATTRLKGCKIKAKPIAKRLANNNALIESCKC